MAETKHYTGSCHCGSVKYEVDLALDKVTACNCSMCGRTGTLLTFVPPSAFKLLQGEETLRDYQFNTRNIHHLFCSTCGVKSFARGVSPRGEMVAINVRCLDGVDLDSLEIQHVDGRGF